MLILNHVNIVGGGIRCNPRPEACPKLQREITDCRIERAQALNFLRMVCIDLRRIELGSAEGGSKET